MKRSVIIFALISTLLVFINTVSASAAELKVGMASVDITPSEPYRLSGYFHERISDGTHDPLMAKAIVFKQGEQSAAMVFCDIIGIQANIAEEVRKQASRETGIPPYHIAIAATHSHTGPLYMGVGRDFFHEQQIAENGSDPFEKINYSAELVSKIVDAIKKANASCQSVILRAGTTKETTPLAFNRRFHMKEGPVRFNPGILNPNIVRPAGPIDPEIGLLSFSATDAQKPFGSLTVFALHLDTTGGTKFSADYPYYLAEDLKKCFGTDFVSVFGTGTCGDINHVDVTNKTCRKASEIGSILAKTVASALPELPEVAEPSLAVANAKFLWPLQTYTEEELTEAKSLLADSFLAKPLNHQKPLPFLKRVKYCTIADLAKRGTKEIALEVQVIRLSPDVAVVALPGEVFVDLGLEIKKNSPFKTTLVFELANQSPAYVPTKKAFDEGSYETVNSRIQPGGGEKMAAEAIKLLKQLKP